MSVNIAGRDKLLQRGLVLEYITLAWNVLGAVIVFLLAKRASSVSLTGFALDSIIEIGASTIVIWELTDAGKNRQKRALRLIGAAFFALAIYVLVQSARSLVLHIHANQTMVGITWLVVTIIAMLALAMGKSRTGKALNNPVLIAEGRVTLIDAYLAVCVLVGLILNALVGWWWADPLAGLVIVFYGAKEGLHAWAEATSMTEIMTVPQEGNS